MTIIPVRMILLQALCLLYLASQGCAQHVIQQRKPQQCFTDIEKVARMKCKLFMIENDLKDAKEEIANLKLDLDAVRQMQVIECGTPPSSPPRGNSTHTGIHYGDTAKYWCDDGHDLHGEEEVQCTVRGKWTTAPCCRKVRTGLNLTVVDWSREDLTDTELTGRLQSLSGYVRKLDLWGNKLTQIPVLGEYTQLDTLEWLRFYSNKIVSFEWDQIPTSIDYLSLSNNKLSILPVVGEAHRCLSVRRLNVGYNNLQILEARQLPVSLTELDVSDNKLSSVPDLSSLPLTVLDIDRNLLIDINVDNLPVSLTGLYLSGNHLTQVPDLSHLPLTGLHLSYNPLTELNGHKLPTTLLVLVLYGDRITVSGVSHLVNLSRVYVDCSNVQYYRGKFPQVAIVKNYYYTC